MMRRSSSEARMASVRVDSRPREAAWSLAYHACAAAPPQAKRRRHRSLPRGATPSMWIPPLMQGTVVPPTKHRRLDTATSLFVDGERNSADSFPTPDSAIYFSPDGRSVTSAGGPMVPLQSQFSTYSTHQTGCGHCHLSRSRGQTQCPFPRALLVDRFTRNEHVYSITDFVHSLGESMSQTQIRSSWLSLKDSSSALAWTSTIGTCSRSVLPPATSSLK